MLKIYHRGPTRGVRVIWQCEEMGLSYQVEHMTPGSDTLKAVNPMNAVPFLEDDSNGVAINESIAMMLYLAEQYGPTPLLPRKGDPALAQTLQFLMLGEATLGMWGSAVILTGFRAPEDQKNNFTIGLAKERLRLGLDLTDKKLGDKPFIGGDTFTLADISMGFALGSTQRMIPDVELPARVAAYNKRLTERPAYQRASVHWAPPPAR